MKKTKKKNKPETKKGIDPLVSWLAEKYDLDINVSADLTQNVKYELIKEARSLLSESNQNKPPFCYRNVDKLKIHKFRHIYNVTYKDIKENGLLIPYKKGFKMIISNNVYQIRKQRYLWAHEIGHTYFYDLTISPPKKKYLTKLSRYWVEEDLAFIFARELLIPKNNLSLRLRKNKPSLNKLCELVDVYEVTYLTLTKKIIIDDKKWKAYIGLYQLQSSNPHIIKTVWSYGSYNKPKKLNVQNILLNMLNTKDFKHTNDIITQKLNLKKHNYVIEIKFFENSNYLIALLYQIEKKEKNPTIDDYNIISVVDSQKDRARATRP